MYYNESIESCIEIFSEVEIVFQIDDSFLELKLLRRQLDNYTRIEREISRKRHILSRARELRKKYNKRIMQLYTVYLLHSLCYPRSLLTRAGAACPFFLLGDILEKHHWNILQNNVKFIKSSQGLKKTL